LSDGSDGAEPVAVICGPTAAGKSTIAMALAARHRRAILVADSRQVYRRFDIGTAKPTPAERGAVPHFGLDLTEPLERYSAAQWSAHADQMIEREVAAGRSPIVVGGTGLYLRALFDGLFTEPATDDRRRAALLVWLDAHPTEELRRWTIALDPARATLGRTQLLRAVAVALQTGEPISRLHETRARSPRWMPRYLVVDPGPALRTRIDERLDFMLDGGWLDEVRALRDVPDEAPAWQSTGYRLLRDVVRGTLGLDEARELILIETRQYAKRQRTWFRHQLPERQTTRVNPGEPDAAGIIDAWWKSVRSS
jgi:tRNA dimethylallyltransferase